MAKIVVTLNEWGQRWAGEGSPRKEGWLPLRGGFCPEINSLAGELQPLSGILMLASVAEHASSRLECAQKGGGNGALGISLIFLIFSPAPICHGRRTRHRRWAVPWLLSGFLCTPKPDFFAPLHRFLCGHKIELS